MIIWGEKDLSNKLCSIENKLSKVDIVLDSTVLERCFIKSQGFNSIDELMKALPLNICRKGTSDLLEEYILHEVSIDLKSSVLSDLYENICFEGFKFPVVAACHDNWLEIEVDWKYGFVSEPFERDASEHGWSPHDVSCFKVNSVMHLKDYCELVTDILPYIAEGRNYLPEDREESYESIISCCENFDYEYSCSVSVSVEDHFENGGLCPCFNDDDELTHVIIGDEEWTDCPIINHKTDDEELLWYAEQEVENCVYPHIIHKDEVLSHLKMLRDECKDTYKASLELEV